MHNSVAEGDQTSTPTQDKTKKTSKPNKKKLAKAGQEDFALDIRPDPVQAKDVLVSLSEIESLRCKFQWNRK